MGRRPVEYAAVSRETLYAEEHVHNKVRWYTKKAAPSATAWADPLDAHLANPWICTSGLATWGVDGSHDPEGAPSDEAFLFGTADTLIEIGTGLKEGDFDQILILANTSATVYLIRFIWGTGTMADAITAKQYTTFPYFRAAADNVRKIQDVKTPLIGISNKIWAQCQNATDNATITFVVGVHGYVF